MFFQVIVLLQTELGFPPEQWKKKKNQVRHSKHMQSVQMQLMHKHLHNSH